MDETLRCYSAAIKDKASTQYKSKSVSLLSGLPHLPNVCTTFAWEEFPRDPAELMAIGTLQPEECDAVVQIIQSQSVETSISSVEVVQFADIAVMASYSLTDVNHVVGTTDYVLAPKSVVRTNK